MDYEKKIDIPFGAHDSELKGWEYTIPEGMEAIIKDGKVIVREKESEDERMRKMLIDRVRSAEELTDELREWILTYLEKQKERGPLTKDEEYILHRIIEHLEDETCPSDWISLLHDIYCLPYEKQKEQKPLTAKEYHDKFDEMYGQYQPNLVEQKSRKFKLGDKVRWHNDDTNVITITGFRDDAYLTDSAYGPILFCDENNWERIEQKPTPKFRVGDKIHLIDGTSPNYEDDCITIREIGTVNYIGEFKEGYVPIKEQDKWELVKEQKPAEWSDEEMKVLDSIIDDYEKAAKSFCGYDGKIGLLKAIRDGEYNLPKPAEWSEEDDALLKEIVSFFKDGTVKLQHDLDLYAGFLQNKFKSLRPQPREEIYQSAKHDLAIRL